MQELRLPIIPMNAVSQRATKSDAQADIGESDDGVHHEDVPADRPLGT